MPDKVFHFDGQNVTIADPANIAFDSPFIREVYQYFFSQITANLAYVPQVDIDNLTNGAHPLDIVARAIHHGEVVRPPAAGASNRNRALVQYHVRHFLETRPEFLGLLRNVVSSAKVSIKNAEFLEGRPTGGGNFIRIKAVIDRVARSTWSRDRDRSENQSGVSVLGQISESLLHKALAAHTGNDFFRVSASDVNSYGDFVVLCLPNNLWISVKSNYARERLLASGYSNDIVGAGFFVEASEFTNPVRIRNFQRAGFLAMYVPDVPVTEDQEVAQTSTYHQVINVYDGNGTPHPLNINGKPFIRPLSGLSGDISALLAMTPVARRLTVRF